MRISDWSADVCSSDLAAMRFLSAEPLLGPVSMRTAVKGKPSLLTKIDWVIVGGESGPRARPMHPDWARTLRDECSAASIAFFFKQVGSWSWKVPKDLGHKAKGVMTAGKFVEFGTHGSQPILRGSKKAAGRRLEDRTIAVTGTGGAEQVCLGG